jgi:hypothetical protein
MGDPGGLALMASRLATPQSLRGIITGYIDPQATVYRGVSMRSRLEAAFAWHLDQQGIVWRYEPAVFGPVGEGYLPDFELPRPDGSHFVEVKPTLRDVPAAKERMTVVWDSRPTAVLVVACAQECRWFACERGGEWISWVDRWSHA